MITRQALADEELLASKTLWNAIEALVSAIDARNGTGGHSTRVASYAIPVAKANGFSAQKLAQIYLGALLHDIGQIYWPSEIHQKQGTPLTEEEREIIKSHTYKGADLVTNWPALHFVKPYILYHQEWIDGSGYPFGLKGDAIPVEVQIVSLADVYEALNHPRLYR
jgi:HD-GYP domain-containing protein (c-di-GMP phosphodiesterase class II)